MNLTLHKREIYSILHFSFIPWRLQHLFTASLSFASSSNFLHSLYYFLDHIPSKVFLPGCSCHYRASYSSRWHSLFKTSCLFWHATPDPFQQHHHLLLLLPFPFNSLTAISFVLYSLAPPPLQPPTQALSLYSQHDSCSSCFVLFSAWMPKEIRLI